jgi:hypothetical protein
MFPLSQKLARSLDCTDGRQLGGTKMWGLQKARTPLVLNFLRGGQLLEKTSVEAPSNTKTHTPT